MSRIIKDQWFLKIASVVSERSTCARRNVGCVLVDKNYHVLSTGYNGVSRGARHCITDSPCSGSQSASGTNLEGCQAIHAEQNALLQCRDVNHIHKCFVTTSPCITCVKLLLNTPCQGIIFCELYPHKESEDLWLNASRDWRQIPLEPVLYDTGNMPDPVLAQS